MTKQAKTITKATTPLKRNPQREQAVRKQRDQKLLIMSGATIFVLLIALVVYLNIRAQQPVTGEEVLTSQGNVHLKPGDIAPVAYNSTPPTSGPHYGNLLAWNIYTQPQRYESLIHNLEDGGVIVYYQCADGCPEVVKELTKIVDSYLRAGRKVIVAPNNPKWTVGTSQPLHKDMGAKIALTAWQRILKMDSVDSQKMRTFIDKYEGIDHHNGGG